MNDRRECLEFMRRYNFASLITAENDFPTATHLPFVIEENGEGIFLIAHFAIANKHWKQISDKLILVIFQEPHAYISPAHYESEPSVPTWNYVAVHAYGTGEIFDKPEAIEKLILSSEPEYLQKWNSYSDDYKGRMFKGIVAVKIKIERLEGKKKLNQKSSETERARIIETLEKSSIGTENDLADYMKKQ